MRRRRIQAQREVVEALNAHAGLVISSAARVLGSVSEAEDVAQDLAERLLRKPPADVRSWPALLKATAVNAAIDRLRRRRPESPYTEAMAESDPGATPEDELERSQKAEQLRRAVAALSERDGLLFSLFYLADLSQQDIAAQLSMTTTAVGVALHRVRQRLKRHLEPTPQTTADVRGDES